MEFMGVFMLCFMGGFALNRISEGKFNEVVKLINVGWAHVGSIFVMINLAGPISGAQFHPGISIGLLAIGEQDAIQTILFIIAQIFGSLAGGLCVGTMQPEESDHWFKNYGYPTLSPEISLAKGFSYEFFATFFLAFSVFIGVRSQQNEKTIATYVAAVLLASICAIGPATGASLNPARNIGPELLSGDFAQVKGWWIYYTACLFAPVIAAFLVKFVIYPDAEVAKLKEETRPNIEHSADYGKVSSDNEKY